MSTIIVYGPPRSGKTLNQDAIMNLFGASSCQDLVSHRGDFRALRTCPDTVVAFINTDTVDLPTTLRNFGENSLPVISISAIKLLLGRKWVEPKP